MIAAGPVVYLVPGGLYASAAPCRIATLLGSCVAVTLWSRPGAIGGMSHYVVPRARAPVEASPRHGQTALAMLLARIEVLGAARAELEARIYGGANVAGALGEQNVLLASRFLRAHGIPVVEADVGGDAGRRITLDVTDGSVTVAA